MISFDAVTKRYPDGTVAVDGLSVEIETGGVTVLLGPSGCGKTTALRMVNRLLEPTRGVIAIDGEDVTRIPVHHLRRRIGYVIQQGGLFPHRSVAENIAIVPNLLGWETCRQRARALELLELVGLDPRLADRYPSQLSGGQQQRVGVARALAADPPVLLMDEPFGAVDPVARSALQHEFRQLQRTLGTTVVFVTHDVDEATALADSLVLLRPGGKVAQHGPPQDVLRQPSDAFVASFLGQTRGLKLLSLCAASDVPTDPLEPGGIRGWSLHSDRGGHPLAWMRQGDPRTTTPVELVGPAGSMRDLLDSALASPAGAAVRVDDAGRLVGVVPFGTLQAHLPKLQEVPSAAGVAG